MRHLRSGAFVLCLAFLPAGWLEADVKTEEKSQVKFEGMMGRMMGLFGGKAMKEGTVSTAAVKGNRKMTVNEYTGQIIDLDEEKIYELDMRGKSYKVTTFAEMRRRMQEAQEKAAQQAGKAPQESAKREPGQKEVEVDFSVKESGQKKTINGYDCREVVTTITTREKGKTLEEGGGMVLTANAWLAPRIATMKEIADFDRRYAEKLEGPFGFAGSAEQMATALAMYPGMKQALGKFQTENVNMDGAAILTVMTMEAVKSQEQLAQEKSQPQQSQTTDVTSVRGMLGGLGRRMAKKKTEEDAGPKTRATVMTMNHELLKVATDVAASDLAIPAGFKEKR